MKCVFVLIILRAIFSNAIDDGELQNEENIIDLTEYADRIYGSPNQRAAENLIDWDRTRIGNPEEMGTYLEGDILFPIKQGELENGRNGIVGQSYRWPNAVVPFEIAGTFDAQSMSLIEKAMNAYHQNTCVKFRKRTLNDRDYISIQNSASGCWSSVGRVGGKQQVNLQSPSCTTLIGTIIHEFMHTVGFFHEHSRDERDQFVNILAGNIRRGYEENFKKNAKGTSSPYGVGYDYGSVMHYSEMAFSGNGKPTIQTKVRFGMLDIYRTTMYINYIYDLE